MRLKRQIRANRKINSLGSLYACLLSEVYKGMSSVKTITVRDDKKGLPAYIGSPFYC